MCINVLSGCPSLTPPALTQSTMHFNFKVIHWSRSSLGFKEIIKAVFSYHTQNVSHSQTQIMLQPSSKRYKQTQLNLLPSTSTQPNPLALMSDITPSSDCNSSLEEIPDHSCHPPKEYKFLINIICGFSRFCHSDWFTKWNWLHYDEKRDCTLCHLCASAMKMNLFKSFGHIEDTFTSSGFRNGRRQLSVSKAMKRLTVTRRHVRSSLI